MKIFPLLFYAVFGSTSIEQLPSLTEIADAVAYAASNTDYSQMWINLKGGGALGRSALSSTDPDRVQAAMLLAGTIIARGGQLTELAEDLSARLCQIVLNAKDVWFLPSVFREKKKELIEAKEIAASQPELDRISATLFPFSNMHYVCGTNLPPFVKVAIFKERVMSSVASVRDNKEDYKMIVSALHENSLEQRFDQLGLLGSDDRAELGLLFDVEYEAIGPPRGQTPVTHWLLMIFEILFSSELLRTNSSNEHLLVLGHECLLTECYVRIGELLGLAIMNNVPIGVSVDKKLLRVMLSSAPFLGNNGLPPEIQQVRQGFFQVVSMTAVVGSEYNPNPIFNVHELSQVLIGRF